METIRGTKWARMDWVCSRANFLAVMFMMVWNTSGVEGRPGNLLSGRRFPEGKYTGASQCRPCHRQIYESWSKSMHRNAAWDPVFAASLRKVTRLEGRSAQQWCLSCHNPAATTSGDFDLQRPLSREGVTCDFCHTVSSVNLAQSPNPFVHNAERVKQSPNRNPSSSAHKTEFSALLTSSKLCGGCHELKSRTGVPLLETYTEWTRSPSARTGRTCQDCHMAERTELRSFGKGKLTRGGVLDHSVSAPRSAGRLRNVMTVAVRPLVRGQDLIVEALVTNAGAGHRIPTGIVNRRIILTVRVMDSKGTSLGQQLRVYQKVLVDSSGEILTDLASQLLRAVRVGKDNRLVAGETRSEKFQFAFPRRSGALIVTATLTYEFQDSGGKVDIEMARTMEVVSFEAIRWRRIALTLLIMGVVSLMITGGWLLLDRVRPRRREAIA